MFSTAGYENLVFSRQRALQLFRRSEMRGMWHKWLCRLFGGRIHLQQLCGGEQRSGERHYVGVKVVALDAICGSEGRAADFDNTFRPTDERTMQRWVNIAQARLEGKALPPVELIQVDDAYYVRDGHHRVSVAKALGEAFIDAEVTMWRPHSFV